MFTRSCGVGREETHLIHLPVGWQLETGDCCYHRLVGLSGTHPTPQHDGIGALTVGKHLAVFVALADAAQLLQLRRRRHREGATAAAAVHDTHVTDGARGGARGGGKGTSQEFRTFQNAIVEIEDAFLRFGLPGSIVFFRSHLLLMLRVDQRHICSAHRHKELWEHGRIEVQGHGLKAHTQLSCEDGFLFFIHAIERHQAPQSAVLPTVHSHHESDGTPQPCIGAFTLALQHDAAQVGNEFDGVGESAKFFLGKLLADLLDDVLGGLSSDVSQLLQRSKLPGFQEQTAGAQGPLAVVNFPGEHHGVHEVTV
mmetsp:Transcript_40381/g.63381  ORF Transcript_40381/g.63381 Transcript_40381/m.63381 type:complete len:311 (+) Transcript_40381:1004-1936(+)